MHCMTMLMVYAKAMHTQHSHILLLIISAAMFYNKARIISFLVRELLLWAGEGSVQLSSAISPLISRETPAMRFFTGVSVHCTVYNTTVYRYSMPEKC
jgi:hypothetical protein